MVKRFLTLVFVSALIFPHFLLCVEMYASDPEGCGSSVLLCIVLISLSGSFIDAQTNFSSGPVFVISTTFARELAVALRNKRLSGMAGKFDTAGIWYARVQDYDDLRTDPQVAANQVFREVSVGNSKATLVNHPLRYDGKVPELRHLATRCGEDGRDILNELGFTEEQVCEFFAQGILYEESEE